MNPDDMLYGNPRWGGYKYFGQGGYIIILQTKYNRPAPVELPGELTFGELQKHIHKFDIVEEYPRGALCV